MPDHAPSPERLAAVATALERIDLTLAGTAAVDLRNATRRLVGEYLAPRVAHPDDDRPTGLDLADTFDLIVDRRSPADDHRRFPLLGVDQCGDVRETTPKG